MCVRNINYKQHAVGWESPPPLRHSCSLFDKSLCQYIRLDRPRLLFTRRNLNQSEWLAMRNDDNSHRTYVYNTQKKDMCFLYTSLKKMLRLLIAHTMREKNVPWLAHTCTICTLRLALMLACNAFETPYPIHILAHKMVFLWCGGWGVAHRVCTPNATHINYTIKRLENRVSEWVCVSLRILVDVRIIKLEPERTANNMSVHMQHMSLWS